MKKNFIIILLFLGIGNSLLTSCNSNDSENVTTESIQSSTFTDLYAYKTNTSGNAVYTKFSFAKGDTLSTDATDWDIAFSKTTIIVNGGNDTIPYARSGNGGLYKVSKSMSEITVADPTLIKGDSIGVKALTTGSGNGWYEYIADKHVIYPISGVTLVIKTHDGKYAKMEIDNYYKGNPALSSIATTDAAGYYTFSYVYQPNSGSTSFTDSSTSK